MKLTKIFFTLLIMCCLHSCSYHNNAERQLRNYKVVVIDSCEYIYAYRGIDIGGLLPIRVTANIVLNV